MSEERILIAHGRDFTARDIERVLEREGLNVVGVVSDHQGLVRKIQETKPTVLVINPRAGPQKLYQ
ncbi:MAG: hypothetical protein FJ044_02845 [Candidatus Cloacimonetes bacterium]|nr:hypothetical protein [Candidatus Cloacimonadota bacterium]